MSSDVGRDLRSRTSDVQYGRAGDAHVAYRVITGEDGGTHDVVLVTGGTMPMEALFEDRIGARLIDGLAALGRLLMFDRQGIGLSDPPSDWEGSPFERWCDDIETVVTAAGFERPVLVGNLLCVSSIALFCAKWPERVRAVAVLEPTRPSRARSPDEWIRQTVSGEFDSVAQLAPSRAAEPGFREWFDRAGRSGASPGTAAANNETAPEGRQRRCQAAVSVAPPGLKRLVVSPTRGLRPGLFSAAPPGLGRAAEVLG